jgi:hypothetical protein
MTMATNFIFLVFKIRKDIPEIFPIIGAVFSRKGRNVDYTNSSNINLKFQQFSKVKLENVLFKNKVFGEKALPMEILEGFMNNNGFGSISDYIKSFGNKSIPFDVLYCCLKPYYFVFCFYLGFFIFILRHLICWMIFQYIVQVLNY